MNWGRKDDFTLCKVRGVGRARTDIGLLSNDRMEMRELWLESAGYSMVAFYRETRDEERDIQVTCAKGEC